ncbi:MAG: nucleotidyltransferase family protein [Acidobacteriia bacterium]|nr:nucleotidyltransferase family protein [Terriglobia bacterium]
MTVARPEEVIARLRAEETALRSLGVSRLGLFGSFRRGDAREESDVDLLVEFEPGRKTFDSFMSLGFFLESLLGRRVELVTPESLSPYIGPRILREVQYVAFRG